MADNRRVRLTKKMMKDALLELLETQPINKITVTDICDTADVNRSTFYAYYEDVGALMLEMENDVLGQLPYSPEIPLVYSDEKFLALLEEFFNYVRENERLFRIMIVQRDSDSFNQRLIKTVMERYRRNPGNPDSQMERYAYVYCVSGVIGILKEWISGGFSVSTRTFSELVLDMSAKATS